MIIARLWTLPTAAFLAFVPLTVNAAVISPSQNLVVALDSALNTKNIGAISNLLTSDYTHGDGYTRETLSQALQRLWKQYPNLTYKTEIIRSDMMNAGAETIETLTTVSGRRSNPSGQVWQISGTIRSQQIVQASRIRSQSILSEQTRITIGEKPPTVMVNLPDTVTVGQAYKYEAVVQEPINDDLFMGTVFDNPVSPTLLTQNQLQIEFPSIAELLSGRTRKTPKPANAAQIVKLSRLPSGGFFKIGTASKVPETRWISAVLARHDGGITIATHRLRTIR